MTERMAFLLFGDQSISAYDTLVDFFRRGNSGVLSTAFLDGAVSSLKAEVDQLSSVDHQQFPIFSSIRELNESYHAQPQRTAALDCALTCITQLLLYIE
jgi:hypothetical protein